MMIRSSCLGETMDRYALVLVGGGLGSLARYVVSTAVNNRLGSLVPLGTMVVNVSGSFLAGLVTERFATSPNLRLLLVGGFLGGYTTFSAFELETYAQVRSGSWGMGISNILLSVGLGYAGVWLGSVLARL
jgi:CrcB protein